MGGKEVLMEAWRAAGDVRAAAFASAQERAERARVALAAHVGARCFAAPVKDAKPGAEYTVAGALKDRQDGVYECWLCLVVEDGTRQLRLRFLFDTIERPGGVETYVTLAGQNLRTQHVENWPDVLARSAVDRAATEIRACPPGPIRLDHRYNVMATGLYFEQVPEPGRDET